MPDCTLYVFVNVSGLSVVLLAVAFSLPVPSSVTVTVIVPVVVPFSMPVFALPLVALSVTVYSYVPGALKLSSLYVAVSLAFPVPLIFTVSTAVPWLSVSAKS